MTNSLLDKTDVKIKIEQDSRGEANEIKGI